MGFASTHHTASSAARSMSSSLGFPVRRAEASRVASTSRGCGSSVSGAEVNQHGIPHRPIVRVPIDRAVRGDLVRHSPNFPDHLALYGRAAPANGTRRFHSSRCCVDQSVVTTVIADVPSCMRRGATGVSTQRPKDPVAPRTNVRGSGTVVEGDLVAVGVGEGEGAAEGAIDGAATMV